jgi:hypothetical protein
MGPLAYWHRDPKAKKKGGARSAHARPMCGARSSARGGTASGGSPAAYKGQGLEIKHHRWKGISLGKAVGAGAHRVCTAMAKQRERIEVVAFDDGDSLAVADGDFR